MGFDLIDRQFRNKDRSPFDGFTELTTDPVARPVAKKAPVYAYKLEDSRVFVVSNFGLYPAVAVGSRVTCNPPPMSTDQDWLGEIVVSTEAKLNRLAKALTGDGWTRCGEPQTSVHALIEIDYPGGFEAFRRGEDNLIVPLDDHYRTTFLLASRLAKRFNLLDKKDRIALFHAIMYQREEP